MSLPVEATTATADELDRYADLAGAVMRLAREIRMREHHAEDDIVVLPASNVQVMQYVDANPGTSPTEVAEATGLQRTNTSTAIRQLEKLGFLERRPDPDDRRVIQLYSTRKALANINAVRRAWADALHKVMSSPHEVVGATEMLSRLAHELATDRRRTGMRSSMN